MDAFCVTHNRNESRSKRTSRDYSRKKDVKTLKIAQFMNNMLRKMVDFQGKFQICLKFTMRSHLMIKKSNVPTLNTRH